MSGTLDVNMYDVNFGVNRSRVKVTTQVNCIICNRCLVLVELVTCCLQHHLQVVNTQFEAEMQDRRTWKSPTGELNGLCFVILQFGCL